MATEYVMLPVGVDSDYVFLGAGQDTEYVWIPEFVASIYSALKAFDINPVGEYISSLAACACVRVVNDSVETAYLAFGPTVELAKIDFYYVIPAGTTQLIPVQNIAMAWKATGPATLLIELGSRQ